MLASGRGSHAENIWNQIQNHYSKSLEITSVISDRRDALVLEKAKSSNIQSHCVEKRQNETKKDHEDRILKILKEEKTDWVLLAGYMKILSSHFLKEFKNETYHFFQVVNIHPSLLPAFKGAHAIDDAFKMGVHVLGATLHLVDEEMDHGPILMQKCWNLNGTENLEDMKDKNLILEHTLYTAFLKILAQEQSEGVAKLIYKRISL